MRVVIKIRAGRDDPVDEAASISGMSSDIPSPAGVSAPVMRHPDRDVGLEHLFREQAAGLAQAPPL